MEYQMIKCDESHLHMLTEFYEKVLKHLCETVNYPKWTPGIYPCQDSIHKAITENVQYMCLHQDTVAGAFILNDDPQGDYSKGDWTHPLHRGEYLVIHTLAVAPEWSRKGIGRRIVDFCIGQAKAGGFKAIRIDAVPDNLPARKLYEKCGFTFAGEKDLLRNLEEIPTFALYEINL